MRDWPQTDQIDKSFRNASPRPDPTCRGVYHDFTPLFTSFRNPHGLREMQVNKRFTVSLFDVCGDVDFTSRAEVRVCRQVNKFQVENLSFAVRGDL